MDNRKVKIFTDSTSDLSKSLIQEMEIEVIPLYVTFNDKTYRDGVDIKEPEVYDKVEKFGSLPKTAAAPPADFEEAFAPFVKDGYDIIYISISEKMSSSARNAVIAAEEFEEANIEVVSAENLSTGIGLLVCAAYDFVKQGKNVHEVAEAVKQLRPLVKTAFTVENVEYLYKGGRCNAVQALFSSMLQIRPIIQVKDGSMIVGAKVRGKKQKALDYMIEEALSYKGRMLHGRLFVTHTSGSEEEALYIRSQLEKELTDVTIHTTYAGCVIASHCGKKTIGILFIAE